LGFSTKSSEAFCQYVLNWALTNTPITSELSFQMVCVGGKCYQFHSALYAVWAALGFLFTIGVVCLLIWAIARNRRRRPLPAISRV
jgi:hypothetical protein